MGGLIPAIGGLEACSIGNWEAEFARTSLRRRPPAPFTFRNIRELGGFPTPAGRIGACVVSRRPDTGGCRARETRSDGRCVADSEPVMRKSGAIGKRTSGAISNNETLEFAKVELQRASRA